MLYCPSRRPSFTGLRSGQRDHPRLRTPYEELEAIRTYLSSYQYTTTVDSPEEGRDFADVFLFDTKTGYCTSFATAMAILGRCALPIRGGICHRPYL
ncbi:MAG: transglutaminase-like domain-containing protein [Blautia marasmi]